MIKRIGLALCFATISMPSWAQTINLDADARSSLSLAIYNQNLSLINDERLVNLPQGEVQLNISAISPLLNRHSVMAHSIPPGVSLIDQQFTPAIQAADVLSASVGRLVTLVGTNVVTGAQTRERARLLSVQGGLVFEVGGHYETDLAGRRIIYDALPDGPLDSMVSLAVESEDAVQSNIMLSYLTRGLGWQADYVVRIDEDDQSLQLSAKATIENQSGIAYENASVELIAGAVNQVQAVVSDHFKARTMALPMAENAAIGATGFADFHLYALPRRLTLPNKSIRQIALFEAHKVPFMRSYQMVGHPYLYYSPDTQEQKLSVDSFVEFDNVETSSLGLPMPAGVIRMYSQVAKGKADLRFAGEDKIGHTPKGAKIRLKTGKAFDLSAVKRQISYKRLPTQQPYRNHNEVTIELLVRNEKDLDVRVDFKESFSGEWRLVDGPAPAKTHARSADWSLVVPAQGEKVLRFTVRVKS